MFILTKTSKLKVDVIIMYDKCDKLKTNPITKGSKWNCLNGIFYKFLVYFFKGVAAMVLLYLILSMVVTSVAIYYSGPYVISIQPNKPLIHVTDCKFLSVALDSSLIANGFGNFSLTNPRLIKLMFPLSPGFLRIGGTMADRLRFVVGEDFTFKSFEMTPSDGGACSYEEQEPCELQPMPNFTMSGKEWLQLNTLAKNANFTILFDLNCLIRYNNGSWNSKNAEELIKFSDENELDVIWELGNEPNSFRHVFNYEVTASQLAKDFYVLKNILNSYTRYNNSLLVGPDTTRPQANKRSSQKYLKKFLQNGGHLVDAVTWHQYYFNHSTAEMAYFLDPDIFDVLKKEIEMVKNIVKSTCEGNKSIWLGETSSAYGGGTPGYSNTYISTFIWLDKLGLAARNGLDLVLRQSLYQGYYALIDDKLFPRPDWWVSVLYKMLVGPQVVPFHTNSSSPLRMYCHCAKKNSYVSSSPAVVVFGMNMLPRSVDIKITGLESNEINEKKQGALFVLTSDVYILSKYILLNGEQLNLSPNGDLPLMKPRIIKADELITLPSYSIVFCVIPSSSLNYCHK